MKSYINCFLLLCVFLMACNGTPAKIEEPKKTIEPVSETTPLPAKEVVVAEIEFPNDPANNPKTTSGEITTVSVSNLEDLVENAKSNTVMYLEKGSYNLESNLVYYMTKDERKIIDKNVVDTRSVGGQLYFSGLENFQLIGKKGSKIISKNPIAVAFFVLQGKNLKFSNLTIIKDEPGNADLCYVSHCQEVEFDKCNFDGGGSYGMYINNTENIKIKNSKIRKCNSGAVRINNSKGITFVNSILSNNICTVPIFNFYGTGCDATLKNVTVSDNKRNPSTSFEGSDRIFGVGSNTLYLENCTIQNNEGYKFLGVNPANINKSQIDGVSM